MFERSAFHDILETIVINKLPPVGCTTHRQDLMTNIIYDYLPLRFKCVAKAKKGSFAGRKEDCFARKYEAFKTVQRSLKKKQMQASVEPINHEVMSEISNAISIPDDNVEQETNVNIVNDADMSICSSSDKYPV